MIFQSSRQGFIKIANRRIIVAHADPPVLLDELSKPHAPPGTRWISGPDET